MTKEELLVAKIFLEDLKQKSSCNEIETLEKALKIAEEKFGGSWILVEEKLPDGDRSVIPVIVSTKKYAYTFRTTYLKDEKCFAVGDDDEVIAWMYWPEKYEPKKSSDNDDIPWIYETGREESEIMGSGSTYSNVLKTYDEKEAFREAHNHNRNYIIRYKKKDGITIKRQWFDEYSQDWIDD